MLRAFQELGIEIALIEGTSRQRKRKWAAVMQQRDRLLGVYSELSTIPIALTDPDHLPRAPFFDFNQFARLRRSGIPVAAFYRDVYWRFSEGIRHLALFKKIPAIAFHQLEAWQIARFIDHVFLPSMRMKEYIPFIRGMVGVSALPPGGRIHLVNRSILSTNHLRLLYVGSVSGELYDLRSMLRAISTLEGVRLTLCCREEDWRRARDRYENLCRVEVVHFSGPQLEPLYRNADVFIMWRRMVEYLRFAMPVKLGEAIGWGLPVITNADCEMGDAVTRDGLGWAISTEDELITLLKKLRDNRDIIAAKQAQVMRARDRHSWEARARTVLGVLDAYRKGARDN